MSSTHFKEFRFGYASAEQESAAEPDLLVSGYLDTDGIIREAREGNRFLFLGYKGSGKSAISEYLRLNSLNSPELFVTPLFLSDFPYSDFKNIVRGDSEPEAKYPTAWSWILLLQFVDSFSRDNGPHGEIRYQFDSIVESLRSSGLLPAPSLKEIVLRSSKKSLKINIPTLFDVSYEWGKSGDSLSLPFFVEQLRRLVCQFKSSSRHILVIDGLDDILTSRVVQFQALAALVLEVSRINLSFLREGTPAKVILLCRTDLYEKLPGANKNKIRQDAAIHLDWYHDPRRPDDSKLIHLANHRARLTKPGVTDLFAEFFPAKIEDKEARHFLLELTRHTPRDFIQLLKNIQDFSGDGPLRRDEILSGVRSYSLNYFVPEVKDELVGYVEGEQIDAAIELLGSLRKRDFWFRELSEMASQRKLSLDLAKVIHALFECSAIGNVTKLTDGMQYYTFKFRNRNSVLNLEDRLILHRGMWKALNLT